ncbi:MAG: lipoate--protein ligase family protein [Solirubrobacteraceae bacterium]
MDRPALELLTAAHPDDPVLDVALTHGLLRAVAAGERPDTLRIFRPGPTVAFGKLDRLLPGIGAAWEVARELGYTPLVRLAGGQAAVYDRRSLVVEHVTAEADATAGLTARFEDQAARLQRALATLGLDVRVGELPGEYCPGGHSLNVGGATKVAGIAQRTIRGAALTTAVLVVAGGEDLRAAVAAIYDALGRDADPEVAGALDDARVGIGVEDVASRVATAYAPIAEGRLDPRALAAAEALRAVHSER